MGSLSSSPRINDCPCYVKHPTTERAPRAHPHETSDGSGRRGGGRGERYLSRAVARARILNNSWSAEEVEDLATPGHFGFSINIPPPLAPGLQKVSDHARNIGSPKPYILLRAQFARPDRYRTLVPPIIFRARNFHRLITRPPFSFR